MSTKSFETSTKMSTPLSNCDIDNVLIKFIPRGDTTFLQLTDVIHVAFVNIFLHHRPDFVVYWIRSRLFSGQSVAGMKSGHSFVNISTVSHAQCAGQLS